MGWQFAQMDEAIGSTHTVHSAMGDAGDALDSKIAT